MIPDPTAEIKKIRHELGAADGFDVGRIFARLRQLETDSARRVVHRAPRRIADSKPIHGSGEVSGIEVESPSSLPRDR